MAMTHSLSSGMAVRASPALGHLVRRGGLRSTVTVSAAAAAPALRPAGLAGLRGNPVLPARGAAAAPAFSASRGAAAAPSRSLRSVSVKAAAEEYDYDLFTIGCGSGGVRASRMSTKYGVKVAACEMPYNPISSDTEGGMGGTCVIRGCVPKKLLVYASHFAEDFKDSEGFGWTVEPPSFDWKKLITNKDTEIGRLNGVYGRILRGANVETMEGRGTIVDEHTVDVDGKQFKCKNILIATGGRAFVPDIPGKELCITSDEALMLPDLPKSIAIVGSGYIALEFACIFNALGVDTHVYFRQPEPLRGFDGEVRTFLAQEMAKKGINMHPGTTPTSVEKDGDHLKFTTSEGEIVVEQVMMATGRKPNIKNLGLEKVGVKVNDFGAIEVDDFSRTNVPSIWAVGDVTDRINLTPVALMEGMALSKTLFGGEPTKPDHTNVACAVFTQPQVATVGMTEEEAVEKLKDVDVYTSSFRPMKNTISGNEGKDFMKLVVDANTGVVVGCHIVGGDAGEIMQGVGIAVKMGATKAQFDSCVGIHPTAAEELVTMRDVTREIRGGKLVEK